MPELAFQLSPRRRNSVDTGAKVVNEASRIRPCAKLSATRIGARAANAGR